MFESQQLSIEFWLRLQGRLTQEFDARGQALKQLLATKPATVDTLTLVLDQAARAREQAYEELNNLELLQALIQLVSTQLRYASFDAGIPEMEQRIEGMRKVIALFSETMCGLPTRIPAEEDLKHAATQMNSLRSAGTGEAVSAERQRLRAMTRDIQVMGLEEGAGYEKAVRSMQTTLDQWEADLQTRRVSTLLSVRVSEELARILASFGVSVQPIEEPQQLEAPQTPAEATA